MVVNSGKRTDKRVARIKEILVKRQPTLTVVLENINDPHNLSACVRSCDAVGVNEIHLIYYGSQPFPKLGKSSSASAKKWVGQKHYRSVRECFGLLKVEGKKIYTTHLGTDSVSLFDLDLSQPVAIVFGNEHDGVSEEALDMADGNLLVPQVGMIQSLNISVACAVILYEAMRQRLKAGLYKNQQLDEAAFEAELKGWLEK